MASRRCETVQSMRVQGSHELLTGPLLEERKETGACCGNNSEA